MYVPSCLLVFAAAHAWRRFEAAAWRQTAERALAPIAVGLVFASGIALMRSTESGLLPWGITVIATIVLAATRINPLVVLSAGSVVALLAARS